ncbi:DUF58 domain-containing protein [Vibrio chagasii]|nr:DUF58 domain-containing protein [Vibrio chagasii]
MDWRVTARTGKAHTKPFSAEMSSPENIIAQHDFRFNPIAEISSTWHFQAQLCWLTGRSKK